MSKTQEFEPAVIVAVALSLFPPNLPREKIDNAASFVTGNRKFPDERAFRQNAREIMLSQFSTLQDVKLPKGSDYGSGPCAIEKFAKDFADWAANLVLRPSGRVAVRSAQYIPSGSAV